MSKTPEQLRDDAIAIWKAGVAAVDSEALVSQTLSMGGDGGSDERLTIGGRVLDRWDRLVVIGAGKAGAGMAAGVLKALGDQAEPLVQAGRLEGWVNVPADCVRDLPGIHLHAARPAGLNEPTQEGVAGAREMLRRVQQLGERDVCLCLISGGGSALMPLPLDGVSLEDKQAITRYLSGAGANIAQLNTVRKQLSQIKGGKLAQACRKGVLATLIISDVLGDPLDIIASGPTIPDSSTPRDALRVLAHFDRSASEGAPTPSTSLSPTASDLDAISNVRRVLQDRQRSGESMEPPDGERIFERVIGNNAVAVRAAGAEARRRGFSVREEPAAQLEGEAALVGQELAQIAMRMRSGEADYDCFISGGEPTVSLAPAEIRGRGGRNQHLVAAAWAELSKHGGEACGGASPATGLTLLSGGTDGEDGPTDAAGAWIDESTPTTDLRVIEDAIQRNDTYHLFKSMDALIFTGPTHTNVCDLRVITVRR